MSLSGSAIASAVLVTVFGALIILADSMWLVVPHSVTAKLKDGYMMRTCYGAQCGMRYMDKFDGSFALTVAVTAIVAVWIPNSVAAAVVAECALCIFHPWMVFVGMAMALGGLLPGLGPMLFVVMNTVFGANLVWRVLDPSIGLPDKFVPVVVGWHILCMLVMLVYLLKVVRHTPKMKYTIKLAKLKEEAVLGGATWIRGKDEPEGFSCDQTIVKKAAEEEATLNWVPYWRTALGMLACFGILAAGLAGAASVDDSSAPSLGYLIYINVGIMAITWVSLLVVVIKCNNGGCGRKELEEGFEAVTITATKTDSF